MNLIPPHVAFSVSGPPQWTLLEHAAGWRAYMRDKALAWRKYRASGHFRAAIDLLGSAIVARNRALALERQAAQPTPTPCNQP